MIAILRRHQITVLSATEMKLFPVLFEFFLDHSLHSFCFSKQYPIWVLLSVLHTRKN